jgi:c-di-GMP-binding flagellar brake protein YcgR
MNLKGSEKRKFPRLESDLRLRYQIRGTPQFGNAIAKDISVGGLRFAVGNYIRPLTDIMLEINMLSRVINPIGRVRWTQALPHSNRYQVGLEFIEIEPVSKNYLSDYINLRQTNP